MTNDLVAAFHLARSEAIKRGMRVTVCKTSNAVAEMPACDGTATWQQGWLVFVDNGARGVIDASDSILRVQGRAHSVVNITNNNYSRYISYRPNGLSQGSNGLANGTISVCVEGNRRDIIVNITGRPRLSSGIC